MTFSPYRMEAMTRAATSIADVVTRLDVWLLCDGSEAAADTATRADHFGDLTKMILDHFEEILEMMHNQVVRQCKAVGLLFFTPLQNPKK